MKTLWQLPKSLQHLVEKRWGSERRGGDRRKGLSLLFQLFVKRNRRSLQRRTRAQRTGPK